MIEAMAGDGGSDAEQTPGTPRPASSVRSVVAGILIAAVIFLAGFAWLITRPQPWTAEALLVVQPSADIPPEESAGYYETLGNGQVVSTYAELLRRRELLGSAVSATSPELDVDDLTTAVAVVPGTALVSVEVGADTADDAEGIADALALVGRDEVARLDQPFALSRVGSAAGTADQVVTVPVPLLVALGVIASVAGIATQQLWARVAGRRPRAAPALVAAQGDAPAT